MKQFHWGILGTGGIVSRLMKGMRQTAGGDAAVIGSRDPEHARAAAERLDIPRWGSYEDVVCDPEVDICYVAVPHPAHIALAELAMEHGKHVLVEKPAAVTAAEWAHMTACAEKNGVFLMEAMWTRLFPAMQALRGLLTPEALGPLKALRCDFSYWLPDFLAHSRNLSPALAGGGLLDTGVYCLHFCDALFGGAPEALHSCAAINTDENRFGVDEQAMILASWPGGRMASMACGVRTLLPDDAVLSTGRAQITIPRFWKPTSFTVTESSPDGPVSRQYDFPVDQPYGGAPDEGFRYELEHVQECISAGRLQSPEISWAATGRVLAQCDTLRGQWGLRYPFEQDL